MNITAESYGRTALLHLKGELTEDSLVAFKQSVDHNLAGKDVIDLALNVEAVPFMDSICLEYLLDLQDKLAERLGQVKLVKPDENLRKILEITRLDSSFEIYDDVTAAVRTLQA